MTLARPTIAAAYFTEKDEIDTRLETIVRTLQNRGFAVAGFLQREFADGLGCCRATFLEDVSSGEQMRITQALGSGSRGCRLDPHGLAAASGRLLFSIGREIDLLVLNRFGKGESEGHGFRAVIEKAHDEGLPVLTAVRPTYFEAWNVFGHDLAETLDPDPEQLLQWCLSAIAQRRSSLARDRCIPA